MEVGEEENGGATWQACASRAHVSKRERGRSGV